MILFLAHTEKIAYLNPIVCLCLPQPPMWFQIVSSWLSDYHQVVVTMFFLLCGNFASLP